MTHIAASPTRPTAMAWTKSSYSGGEGNECVEVAFHGTAIAVRDSKALARGTFSVPHAAFAAFIEGLKH